jgi:hypothetical protein
MTEPDIVASSSLRGLPEYHLAADGNLMWVNGCPGRPESTSRDFERLTHVNVTGAACRHHPPSVADCRSRPSTG